MRSRGAVLLSFGERPGPLTGCSETLQKEQRESGEKGQGKLYPG